jgi:hypothetical protein
VKAKNVFETIESMSTTITSLALATNATWPFVTVPNFAARGSQVLKLSGSFYLALTPLVSGDQREEWELYAQANRGWLIEDVDGTTPEGAQAPPIIPFIWDLGSGSPSPPGQLYGPFWQLSPPVPYVVNQDIFTVPFFDRVYAAIDQTRKIVLSPVSALITDRPMNDTMSWPYSYISAPIFETLQDSSPLVAMTSAVLPWHKYFIDAVPDGLGDIFVVVTNTCGQAFTYRVDGSNIQYVGPDDLHDTKYNDMILSSSFDVLESLDNVNSCPYTVSVYPSSDFEDGFKSKAPVYYTVIVLAIFVMTSAVFVIYDWFVKRKDNKVQHTAANSNAIITSLFPAQVRDRLIEDAARRRKTKQDKNARAVKGVPLTPEEEKMELLKTKPIADLFPAVTVMFADIAGFTAWSSVRDPAQVFTLLEQIYGSFDALAKRRGVFKVETIGDCYVAVAGLPEPRADHAVVMTRFARDCMNEMNQVAHQLEVVLGPDTGKPFGQLN